eukprot:TCALIF_12504-PA protein Name:"Similar to Hemocyte protein-glutamine gamma-glutamyltransferase (Tachypleus tridentatus)" AED:0.06 eAED:0.06 QI:229/0.77/0.6/1/0.55/0.5/10/109/752
MNATRLRENETNSDFDSPWSNWTIGGNNSYFLPPLWHFHRTLASRPRIFPSELSAGHVLEIDGVDFNVRENASKHATSTYELVQTRQASVLRRGEPFTVNLVCQKRNYDPNRDSIKFTFEFGSHPSTPKGTKGVFQLEHADDTTSGGEMSGWRARFIRKSGPNVEVRIFTPADLPVGLWRLYIDTWYENRWSQKLRHTHSDPIYMLFNPFHANDSVYLPKAAEREEFVLNEVGKIYGGSHNRVKGRPWIFGQFRDSVLPAVCHILETKAKIKDADRADPVQVTRAISAVVNALDEDGLLMGRWDGNYGDGTKPFEWTGSVAILEEFMRTQASVKYGQCWVFAGVVTTICRSLGIPCRPVTNYISAHDTNRSLSVDKFYNEAGEEVTEHSLHDRGAPPDSIWNFHVWNEVWLQRPDLVADYSGWQVIDSTPQEPSEATYRCGPAPVEAVRRGQVGLSYDVTFVFAEVNADLFVYVPDPKSLIITKSLGYLSETNDDDYDTRTEAYKYREGSMSERLSVMGAVRSVGGNALHHRYPGPAHQDVFLQMIDLDQGVYGEPYKASLFLHNQSSKERTIRVVMSTSSVFYTGRKAHLVKKGVGEFALKAFERETLSMEVLPEDYMPKTVEYCMFSNRFLVTVAETEQTWTGEDDFLLAKPSLKVSARPELPRAHRSCHILVRLTNPLSDSALTECEFSIEAPGMVESLKKRFKDISPGETAEVSLTVTPWRSGSTTIVAAFNSLELFNLTGSKKVTVV